MGFSFKRLFKNPFGKHSIFGKATQIASVLPIPGAGLVGKAFGLMNRSRTAYDALTRRAEPILTAAGARSLVPSQAPKGVMPGGARTTRAARPTQMRVGTHRRAVGRSRRKTTRRRRR